MLWRWSANDVDLSRKSGSLYLNTTEVKQWPGKKDDGSNWVGARMTWLGVTAVTCVTMCISCHGEHESRDIVSCLAEDNVSQGRTGLVTA